MCYTVFVNKNSTRCDKMKGDMEMKVTRKCFADKVRQMCINHNYYTQGDCLAYDRLLQFVDKDLDANNEVQMTEVAQNIYNHSNINKMMEEYNCTEEDILVGILFNLYNDCTMTFVTWEA